MSTKWAPRIKVPPKKLEMLLFDLRRRGKKIRRKRLLKKILTNPIRYFKARNVSELFQFCYADVTEALINDHNILLDRVDRTPYSTGTRINVPIILKGAFK